VSVALVTGGARRIGAAIVRQLAGAGYTLAIHCNTSRAEADALAAELGDAGQRAHVLSADLADAASLAPLVRQAAALGSLSLLVNNASLFEDDRIGAIDPAMFERQIALSLRAPLLLTEAFAAVAGAGASVVNIIDQRVLKPTPDHVSYALAKSALWTLTVMSAQALAPSIRVNAIAPGPTLPNILDGSEGFAREAAAVPLAHAVPPQAIADAVLYLARAASVTGTLLPVDAGQHIGWKTPDVAMLDL